MNEATLNIMYWVMVVACSMVIVSGTLHAIVCSLNDKFIEAVDAFVSTIIAVVATVALLVARFA